MRNSHDQEGKEGYHSDKTRRCLLEDLHTCRDLWLVFSADHTNAMYVITKPIDTHKNFKISITSLLRLLNNLNFETLPNFYPLHPILPNNLHNSWQ